MPRLRGWSGAVAALVVTAAVVVPTRPAHACSCAGPTAVRDLLGISDVAFVGRLASRAEVEVDPDDVVGPVALTFDVLEPIKGELGRQVVVRTGRGGGDCGLERLPDTVGLLAFRGPGGVLTVNTCASVHPPDELRAAAAPLPAVGGEAVLVAGARYGPGRVVGLARDGTVVGVGEGSGTTFRLAPCPGGSALVELVGDDHGLLLQGRTATLAPLGPEVRLEVPGGPTPVRDLACLAPDASRAALVAEGQYPDGVHPLLSLGVATADGSTTTDLGVAAAAGFDADRGALWLLAGADDAMLDRLDLTSLARRTAWRPDGDRVASGLAVDPAQGRVAVLVGPAGAPPAPWPSYRHLVDEVVVLDERGAVLAVHPVTAGLDPTGRWVRGTLVLQGTDPASSPQTPAQRLVQVDPRAGEQRPDAGLEGTVHVTELADGALMVPSARAPGIVVTDRDGTRHAWPLDVRLTSEPLALPAPTTMAWPGRAATTPSSEPGASTTATVPDGATGVALGAPTGADADGDGGDATPFAVLGAALLALAGAAWALRRHARRRAPVAGS